MYNEGKALIKKDTCMKFYNENKSLYLYRDALGTDLGACPLQVRNTMNCAKDTAPDNTILRPIAFTSKGV